VEKHDRRYVFYFMFDVNDNRSSRSRLLKSFGQLTHNDTGICGGACEALALHPLDTVKTRLQLQGVRVSSASAAASTSGIPTNFVGYGRHLARTEGVAALYKGLTPFVTHLMTKYSLRYYVNFQLRSLVADENGNTTFVQNLFCGMSAGTIEALMIVTPFEVVKTRLQAQQGSLIPGKKAKYRGPVHAVFRILRKEGPGGLWKGCGPTVFRQATNQMSMFTTYTWIRENIWGNPESMTPFMAASTGLVASTVGPLFNCPSDVIKTRLMNQTHSMVEPEFQYKGFADAFMRIWREEGFRALYKGIGPRLARLAPGQAITWVVVEQFRSLCDRKEWFM